VELFFFFFSLREAHFFLLLFFPFFSPTIIAALHETVAKKVFKKVDTQKIKEKDPKEKRKTRAKK